MTNPLECRFEAVVELPRDRAFKLIVDHPDLWWASRFSSNLTGHVQVGIEPYPGGSCYEICSAGQHKNWGTVLSIEEPLYIRLAWQVSADGEAIADPSAASRVMISFRDSTTSTRLEVVHTEFLRHGEHGGQYQEIMNGPSGWPQILKNIQNVAVSAKTTKLR